MRLHRNSRNGEVTLIEDFRAEAMGHGRVDLASGTWERGILPFPLCVFNDTNIAPGYPDLRGLPKLREQIAKHYGAPISPENVFVTQGATGGIMTTLAALTETGEEVLTVAPCYPGILDVTRQLGLSIRTVPAVPCEGHSFGAIDWTALRTALSPKTKIIFLCDPDNPTGRVLDEKDYCQAAALCAHYGVFLVVDRTYEAFSIQKTIVSTAKIFGPNTIIIGSISKSLAAASLRVGWILAPYTIDRSVVVTIDAQFGGVTQFAQEIVARALSQDLLSTLHQVAKERHQELSEFIQQAGLLAWPVGGGIFMCVETTASSERDAWTALAHQGVIGIPGFAFSVHAQSSASFVRLCFARSSKTIASAGHHLTRMRAKHLSVHKNQKNKHYEKEVHN